MKQKPHEQKREYFRLRYPASERPKVEINEQDYEVLEISEKGFRIHFTHGCAFAPGQPFSGVIQYRDGDTILIEGIALRSDSNEMAAMLSRGPSLKRMVSEQIRIKKKYPMFFEEPEADSSTEPA